MWTPSYAFICYICFDTVNLSIGVFFESLHSVSLFGLASVVFCLHFNVCFSLLCMSSPESKLAVEKHEHSIKRKFPRKKNWKELQWLKAHKQLIGCYGAIWTGGPSVWRKTTIAPLLIEKALQASLVTNAFSIRNQRRIGSTTFIIKTEHDCWYFVCICWEKNLQNKVNIGCFAGTKRKICVFMSVFENWLFAPFPSLWQWNMLLNLLLYWCLAWYRN